MYSFRARAKMSAEDREKYLDKKTREEILANYLNESEDFAKDDDDSNIDSNINVEIPF